MLCSTPWTDTTTATSPETDTFTLSPPWDRHLCFKPPMGQTFFALHPIRQMLLGCIMPHGQMFKVMKAPGTYTQPSLNIWNMFQIPPGTDELTTFHPPLPPRYRQIATLPAPRINKFLSFLTPTDRYRKIIHRGGTPITWNSPFTGSDLRAP